MASRFWVGGAGVWSGGNWSATSGGAPGALAPTSADDARFDANSFSGSGQTVTLDVAVDVHDFVWTGVTNSPTLAWGGQTVTVRGDFTLVSGMALSGDIYYLTFQSASTQTLTLAGKALSIAGPSIPEMAFKGGGTWNMADDWVAMPVLAMFFEEATFNTNDHALTVRHMFDGGGHGVFSGVVNVNYGTSAVKIIDGLVLRKTGTTVDLSTAALTVEPDIDFTALYLKTVAIGSLRVYPGTNTGEIIRFGNSTNATIGELILEPASGATVSTVGGGAATIGALTSNGVPGNLASISRTWTASGPIAADYLRVASSTLLGVTPGLVGAHGQNGGGNTGWEFEQTSTRVPSVSTIPTIGRAS